MGLDMYLECEIYIGAQYEHNEVELEINARVQGETVAIDVSKVSEIIEQAAYWRKANAIHNWFVQNVQNGVDECQRSWVRLEQLYELSTLCKAILAKHENGGQWEKMAGQYLPPVAGFFFGETDLDDWYLQDLKDTVRQLKPCIEDNRNKVSYYYRASW